MAGTVDSGNGAFTLVDTSIGDVSGDIGVATYTVSFSPDYRKMTGTWITATSRSEGTFEADKK